MTNHFHFLVETVEGNLSQGMRQLNGIYSQRVNRRHGSVGHVFQGRYHAVLVQKEAHLLELARYIVLNPVRARMVLSADEWHWSSHHCMLNSGGKPRWLNTQWLLGQFGPSQVHAVDAYRQFVAAGAGSQSPLKHVRHEIVLGGDEFAAQHREQAELDSLVAVSKAHRRIAALTLPEYEARIEGRDRAMAEAYFSTAFTMAEIGEYFKVSYKTVSRAVKRYEPASP